MQLYNAHKETIEKELQTFVYRDEGLNRTGDDCAELYKCRHSLVS